MLSPGQEQHIVKMFMKSKPFLSKEVVDNHLFRIDCDHTTRKLDQEIFRSEAIKCLEILKDF